MLLNNCRFHGLAKTPAGRGCFKKNWGGEWQVLEFVLCGCTSGFEKSVLCAKEVADLANSREVLLFDTNAVVHELCSDGCHFTVASHKAFAEAMADFIAVEQG